MPTKKMWNYIIDFKKEFVLRNEKIYSLFREVREKVRVYYLALFVPKTPLVVWYSIMNSILLKFHGYLALFESKSVVIFICFHCLIIFFKLHKITQTLCRVFSFPNLNFYLVFHYWNTCLDICFNYFFCYFMYLRLIVTL